MHSWQEANLQKKHRFNTILFYGILLELILSNLNVNLNFGLIMMNNRYLGRFHFFRLDELNSRCTFDITD